MEFQNRNYHETQKFCAAWRILPGRLMMILIDFSSVRGRPWVLNTNFFRLWMAHRSRIVFAVFPVSVTNSLQVTLKAGINVASSLLSILATNRNTTLHWMQGRLAMPFVALFICHPQRGTFFQCVNISNVTSWGGFRWCNRSGQLENVSNISFKVNSRVRLLKFASSPSHCCTKIDTIQWKSSDKFYNLILATYLIFFSTFFSQFFKQSSHRSRKFPKNRFTSPDVCADFSSDLPSLSLAIENCIGAFETCLGCFYFLCTSISLITAAADRCVLQLVSYAILMERKIYFYGIFADWEVRDFWRRVAVINHRTHHHSMNKLH